MHHYQKLLQTDIPDPRSGKLTARPSGKFCIPIPIARFLQQSNIDLSVALSSLRQDQTTNILELLITYAIIIIIIVIKKFIHNHL